jgi:hypothetical protein
MGNLMQKSERKAFKALVKKNTTMNREMPVEEFAANTPSREARHGRNVSFNEKVRWHRNFECIHSLASVSSAEAGPAVSHTRSHANSQVKHVEYDEEGGEFPPQESIHMLAAEADVDDDYFEVRQHSSRYPFFRHQRGELCLEAPVSLPCMTAQII